MLKNQSLSQSLHKTWSNYEEQVHLSRNQTSPKNIHQLRISTQKLEAVLSLAHSLHATHHSKNIISLIKNVRKSLGPLRDIHVESTALENLIQERLKAHKLRKFSKFFAKRKGSAKKKASKCLRNISLSQERKRVDRLAQKLKKNELDNDKNKIEVQLNSIMKSSFLKLNKVMKNVNPERIKEIHRFRIMAKKIRYQAECLNLMTGLTSYNLQKLKDIQSVAGRIQNDGILICTIDRFLAKKKHGKDIQALKIRKRIKDNQDKLINDKFSQLSAIKWQN